MLRIFPKRFIQLVQDGYFSKINEPSKNEVYRVNKVDDTPTGKVENIVIIKVGEKDNYYRFVITNEYIDCFPSNVRIHITDILRHRTVGLQNKDVENKTRTRICYKTAKGEDRKAPFARALKFIQKYNEIGEIKTSEDLNNIIRRGQEISASCGGLEAHHINEKFRETLDSLQLLTKEEHQEEGKKRHTGLDYIGKHSCDHKVSKEEVEADLRRIFT